MFKIWCQEIPEDKPYDPNHPIDRNLGFEWRQYLFADKSIPLSQLSFNLSENIIASDFFEADNIPIVSEKIKNILTQEVPNFVEFSSVKILDNNKRTKIGSFFVVKINNSIECFDWDKSVYQVRHLKNGIKRISSIQNLFLNQNVTNNQEIFRISELNCFLVGVREDLCKKIINTGAKGIEFKEPSQILM